jgi:DNA-binding transcriptional ArsR family regulator
MGVGEPVDYDKLEEYLQALAYTSRLELLHLLRQPRVLQDIRLAPRQLRPGDNPDRNVARQTIRAHLEKLEEIGVVVSREASGEGQRGKEYLVNTQRMYQVLEELRKVATITTGTPAPRLDTVDLGAAKPPTMEDGPKLLLVHGLVEGKVFPLRRSDLKDGRGWVLGRKPGLHVSLDYDPYVSVENAEVLPTPGGLALMDLRSSKNGTFLNWRRLDKDERATLTPGDVIGVGRSTLVYRAA